jgi:hypothetical protein
MYRANRFRVYRFKVNCLRSSFSGQFFLARCLTANSFRDNYFRASVSWSRIKVTVRNIIKYTFQHGGYKFQRKILYFQNVKYERITFLTWQYYRKGRRSAYPSADADGGTETGNIIFPDMPLHSGNGRIRVLRSEIYICFAQGSAQQVLQYLFFLRRGVFNEA